MLNFKNILSASWAYVLLQKMIAKDLNQVFFRPYLKVSDNEIVLDVGCGPADVLAYLPLSVTYYGYDLSDTYIKYAQEKYKNRKANFRSVAISAMNLPEELKGKCDVVLAIGLLHHLNDEEVAQFYQLAKIALKPGGRVITLDNCYCDNQNPVARFIISQDRGRYSRHISQYERLAKNCLDGRVKSYSNLNFLRIPYNHLVLEWIKA